MSADEPSRDPPRLRCPGCGTGLTWRTDNPWRPFCSRRCKDEDFIGWAREEHRITGDTEYDDLLSGDLEGNWKE